MWAFQAVGDILSSPAVGADGAVYIASKGYTSSFWPMTVSKANVYALDGGSGTKKWEFQVEEDIYNAYFYQINDKEYISFIKY